MQTMFSHWHHGPAGLGVMRIARGLAGALGLMIVAAQVGMLPAAHAAPLIYRYERGYYLDNGWFCYGWNSGEYHCTQHWYVTTAGQVVSDNIAWVPNYAAAWYDAIGKVGTTQLPAAQDTDPAGATASAQQRQATTTATAHQPVYQAVVAQPAASRAAPAVSSGQQSVAGEIGAVFGPYANAAISVAQCESGLNPGAYNRTPVGNSHAAGVFQILYPSTWDTTAYSGDSPYNASDNIHAAYQIFARDGYSWREWACQP